MRIVAGILVCSLTLDACFPSYIKREKAVYASEVNIVKRSSAESAAAINNLLADFCVCEEGRWSASSCEEGDAVASVLEQRMPYHTDMMLFLGGLSETAPEEVKNLKLKCGE